MMDADIERALTQDDTVDITTMGRQTGQPRRIEIWFRNVNGRILITGTPGSRDWYANLLANPEFTFHLKQSVEKDLRATARPIVDPEERREIFSHKSMAWYRQQVRSVEVLVEGSPLVEVIFDDLSA